MTRRNSVVRASEQAGRRFVQHRAFYRGHWLIVGIENGFLLDTWLILHVNHFDFLLNFHLHNTTRQSKTPGHEKQIIKATRRNACTFYTKYEVYGIFTFRH